MLRYVTAAFWVRVKVSALGDVPVNAMAAVGFGILGLANPGFWLLGVAVEAGVLSALAFNRRFQRVVDGRGLLEADANTDVARARQNLIDALPAPSKQRMSGLSAKCTRVLTLYQAARADGVTVEGNREALRNLEWVYLKLLVADAHLRTNVSGENEQ